jgi:sterol 3beta-glucosyltransferase
MKIAIVTVGTRGDVQPYIAIALALMARGHEVKIAVSEDHAPLLHAYGIPHHPIGANVRDLLRTDLGRAWLSSADSPRKYTRYLKEIFLPMQRAFCEDAEAAVAGADGVAFYALAFHAMHAAERRRLPMVALSPWPMIPTTEMPPLVAIGLANAPGFVRKLASHAVLRFGFSAFNEAHQSYRESVGLPRYRARDTMHAILETGMPCVNLLSEVVLPRPKDWAPHHHMTGFPFTPPLQYEPPRALADFLAAGPPPIYIGFGSMTGFDPNELAELATRAARAAGVRAIIATGWAELDVAATGDVFVVDEIPHDWLFPRVSAVIHHGGVGTFAQGLRAGKPTVIAAFFADQPFWGWLNARLGTGPAPLMRANLAAPRLAAAIRQALDGAYTERARELGERIRAEDGSARAAEVIEASLSRHSRSSHG